jgi:hypothetical protein
MSLSNSGPSNLLIITSSAGGGLLQAAIAMEQELRAKNPDIYIVKKDVLKDWVGRALGQFSIAFWNKSQRNGHVRAQVFALKKQWLFDLFIWPNVFYKTLRTLFRENIDRVIDTQMMGTSAIATAIRVFNRKTGKRLLLEKIVVDLPTSAATHYFRPIKKLSRKNKRILKLSTILPLLEEGQTAEAFWQENCGLSEADIHYGELNVRQSFRKLQGQARSQTPLLLPIRVSHGEELQLMRQCLDRGSIGYRIVGQVVQCTIHPEDRVFTVLLGSQPANGATLNYVKKFLATAREDQVAKIPTHLFVFCADHTPGKKTLFSAVAHFVSKAKNYPKYFSVIPFSFQTDEAIAPLFHRSDLTCTRSGGQTAMELMAVSRGEMWVHSEAREGEDLLSGIPGWEGASALYLQKLRGAKIVTIDTFVPEARRHLRAKAGQSLPSCGLESMS